MECWAFITTLTFDTTKTTNVSSVIPGPNVPPRKFLGTHFCYRLSGLQNYTIQTEEIDNFKISKDPTGNRTRNLQFCSAVSQPTAPQTFRNTEVSCGLGLMSRTDITLYKIWGLHGEVVQTPYGLVSGYCLPLETLVSTYSGVRCRNQNIKCFIQRSNLNSNLFNCK